MLKKLFHWAKPRAALLLERALLWYFSLRAKHRRCKKETGRVLVTRTDHLGDFVLWMDAQKQLRRLYPDKKLVLLTDFDTPTAALARYCPDVDEVLSVHVFRFVRFLEVPRMLRRSYDIVLAPKYSRTIFTDVLAFACRADRRIALETGELFLTPWEHRLSDRGYDEILPASRETVHELERAAEMLRGLGLTAYRARLPRMFPLPECPVPTGAYIAVYPGGSIPEKCWEPWKFAEVCDWLCEETRCSILLCGGKNDTAAAAQVIAKMRHGDCVTDRTGRDELLTSCLIVRGARLVFGNDTGMLHIAALYRAPALAIVVDREYGRFFPYPSLEVQAPDDRLPDSVFADLPCRGCFLEKMRPCVFPAHKPGDPFPCIEQITVEQVKAKLLPLIREETAV